MHSFSEQGGSKFRWLAYMAARYGVVGAICATLNIIIMFVATTTLAINYVVAAVLAFCVTVPLGYLLHRRITFAVSRKWGDGALEFCRFVISQGGQFGIGLGMLVAIVQWAGLSPTLGMVIVTILMFCFGFAANAAWVFRVFIPGARRVGRLPGRDNTVRLLQVSAFFPKHGGGVEVVAGELARRLADSGVLVHWMAGGGEDERPDATVPGLTIDQAGSLDFLEARLGLPSPIWSFSSVTALWRATRGCDVVHVHDCIYMPTLCAMGFAIILRKPIVLTKHIGPIRFESRLATVALSFINHSIVWLAMRSATQVIFVGRPVLDYFVRFAKFKNQPLLISNGVDHATYRPSKYRRMSDGKVHCLFVGRFVEKKGLELIRKCMGLPGVRWTFVGWGPLSPRKWNLGCDEFAVLEGLRAQQVVPYYQSADLFVLPSVGEGFPLVVQEALACGTPVLVSKGIAEAFPSIDPRCVFAIDVDKADAVAALRVQIQRFVDNRSILTGAREFAITLSRQWSWETCVARHIEIYLTMIDDRPLVEPKSTDLVG